MSNFIPQILPDPEADSARNAERIVVKAMRDALGFEKVAAEIAPFKTDGNVTGHRVLDDDRAVKALVKHAPEHIRTAITSQKIGDYRMTQLLNRVLRAEFEMVKGKLTGRPSPKVAAKRAARGLTDETGQQ
jgi:hypothetical protein